MKERDFTPKEITEILDRHIVGQANAKKAVAVALRNRLRRQKLAAEMQEEVTPKNILMIGPTGVGKTEIARRLAKIEKAPFLKVEASKYTEVGYVGRDVESMIRDLVKISVNMVREEHMEQVRKSAESSAEERLLDLLVPPIKPPKKVFTETEEDAERVKEEKERFKETREKMRRMLLDGKMEDKTVEMSIRDRQMPMMEIFSGGMDEAAMNIQEMVEGMSAGGKVKKKKMTIAEARELIINEETQKLIDMDKVIKEAVEKAENSGMVFIDEIDKIAGSGRTSGGPDVSREGVQRDILPIVEGTTVMTKYGAIKTDHILFIAAGAFHSSKPSDLIPELQGRFPIRVELDSLTMEDFERILKEPQNSLIKQYTALLETDDVEVVFETEAIKELARMAFEVNEKVENIGARRLYTIIEKVLEEVLFDAPYGRKEKTVITKAFVEGRIKDLIKDGDLSRYIL